MSIILADTSGLYSLLSRRGQHHTEAMEFYSTLPRQTEVIVIEYILLETMTLLRARGFSDLAVQFRQTLFTSQIFTLRYSTPELEQATFDVFRRYADKEWSYADCALLATSNRLNASLIFSFDHHIDQMGLQRTPTISR
jgi:predicted nucleic acid-binding protein